MMRYDRDAAPLKAELANLGFSVDAISDLFRLGYDYRPAVPVLLKWLPRLDNLHVKEGIVRALTDKWARPAAAKPLIEEFKRAPMDHTPPLLNYKWAIGNALAVVADDSVFEEIKGLLRDKRHSWSRSMLTLALGRMRNPEVDRLLIEVLQQDQGESEETAGMSSAAIRALGNRKAVDAKVLISSFLTHPLPAVRKEAVSSIKKIERAEQKALSG